MDIVFLRLEINEDTEVVAQIPYDMVDTLQEDSSVLVNIAQQYFEGGIRSIRVIGDQEADQESAALQHPEEHKLWTDDNTKLLIELYTKFSKEFETGIKKHVWSKVGNLMSQKVGVKVLGTQCDTKSKGLMKHYKMVKKHNETSGNDPKFWKFFDLLNEILYKKPEIRPVATCSSARGMEINEATDEAVTTDCATTSSGTSTPTLKRKRRTVENNIDKRHRERMQRQDQFIAILKDIANTMKDKKCDCQEKNHSSNDD